METPTIDQLQKIAEKYGYPIFKSQDVYNYNLNIWGFRSTEKDASKFNDMIIVFRQSRFGHWFIDRYDATTDPSDLTLMSPQNIDGTAILCEGHHKALWHFGFHKQRKDHKALVQHSPCIVYRDNDRNKVIDYGKLKKFVGMFGINMHRASAYGTTAKVGLYSAGCQVHANVDKYNEVFIPTIEAAVSEGFRTFSYTLCLEKDLYL